jgi:hypothetical protein
MFRVARSLPRGGAYQVRRAWRLAGVAGAIVERKVELAGHGPLTYDYRVVATGAAAATFGVPGVARHS